MIRPIRFPAFLRLTGLAVAMALSSPSLAAAPAAELPPPVVRAVVYPDRGLVTRAVDVACRGGLTPALFRNLPPGIDPTTVRAAASGSSARVEGVAMAERVLEESQSVEVRALDEEIENVQRRIREQSLERERANAARERAESLRRSAGPFLAREAAQEKKPNTAAWSVGLDAVRGEIEAADVRRRGAETALRELNRRLQELSSRRAAISSAQPRRVTDAEVMVRCEGSGGVRAELSYMAGGLSWTPLYEARAAESRDAIELSVLAQVVQATGEAWKGVELALSTAVTRRDATPPEPQRLYLGATPQDQKKKVLVRRDVEVRHVESTDAGGAEAAGEGAMAAADQGLSVRLEVPGRVDFPGDGRPARVKVETLRLAAAFGLLTIPKLLPHTVRRAEAVNRARYPLIPGRVDLFSGGSFVGSTRLERVEKGDKVRLAFGIDEQVKVRRVVLEEDRKDPGFLGSTRRLTYAYRFEVASFAPRAVEVALEDHVPVSQLDDVKVILDEKTTKGFELAKEDGIVTWKLKLAPKEKKLVELRFAVEVPSKYESGGI